MDTMREDFEHILKMYGHDVFIQRAKAYIPGQPVSYEEKLERHTTRHMLPTTRGLPTVTQEQIEGLLYTAERLYYFKHDVVPYEGDRIYEIDESRTSGRQAVWNIDSAMPMRGRHGNIIYWIVGTTRERPN